MSPCCLSRIARHGEGLNGRLCVRSCPMSRFDKPFKRYLGPNRLLITDYFDFEKRPQSVLFLRHARNRHLHAIAPRTESLYLSLRYSIFIIRPSSLILYSSAPCFSSISANSVWPRCRATASDVIPLLSLMLTFTPEVNSVLATSLRSL